MRATHRVWLTGALVFAAACAATGADAQAYPNRAIRLISPFPPGGSVDLVGRLVAARLTESLGQQVVVDNRSGASGNIGTELAARAAPDGYTLLVNTLPFVVNVHLQQRVPYDPIADFEPVCLVSASPSLLAVHPSVPARSVKELLAIARARPGALNYGTAGTGTNPHIAGEFFNFLGKVSMVPVHFKGGGPALVATVSGEVGIAFSNVAETSAFVKSGRLRGLAVTSLKRSAAVPALPTVSEAGLPGYEFTTWQGVFAPKNTPRAVVGLVNERLRKSMAVPENARRFTELGLDVIASTPEEFGAHLKRELEKWGRVIKDRGLRAE